jgi:outer membrane protein assembly factor BamB/uncharacterized membrane protein YtjA (UPF0391 family)
MVPKDKTAHREPLRLWPGVLAVTLQWLGRFVVPAVVPGAMGFGALAAVAGGLAVVLWWLFLSRAPRAERWGAVALMLSTLGATYLANDQSMGQLWLISYAAPVLSLAFVAWAVAGRNLADRPRRVTMVVTIVLACGAWTLVRSHGIIGDGAADFGWRWSETPEQRLLARGDAEAAALPKPAAALAQIGAWPGFRGPARDSVLRGTRIETDWSRSPPVELWRRPVGPGWSSFAVHDGLLFTQEQRGDEEIVASYRLATGEPVWRHGVEARFWESQAGPGPRATPTVSGGRVYALGATGILSVLDESDGSLVWSRDAAADARVEVPYWGFSGSPWVTGDVVIVAVSGTLLAYEIESGEPRWVGPPGAVSYSSPHLVTIDGVEQLLMPDESGVVGVSPDDGSRLWEYRWPGFRILQPALAPNGDILLCSERNGTRRLDVSLDSTGWNVEERWTTTGLKPYFSDFVIHEEHVYVLLVLTERGEMVLVAATPDGFEELARAAALDGKTWNHPVLVSDQLLLRNSQEMVAFRLARAGG